MSVEEMVFCMDFSHGVLKPTKGYDNLSADTKKKRSSFEAKDGEKLKLLIDEALATFQLPDHLTLPLSIEKWHDIFAAAATIIAKKNAKRKYKEFGLTLAGTHPRTFCPRTPSMTTALSNPLSHVRWEECISISDASGRWTRTS
jgi:hypothetical protein